MATFDWRAISFDHFVTAQCQQSVRTEQCGQAKRQCERTPKKSIGPQRIGIDVEQAQKSESNELNVRAIITNTERMTEWTKVTAARIDHEIEQD